MDVSSQVDSIVNNLVRDIESRVNARVDTLISNALQKRLEDFDYEKKLNYLASIKLDTLLGNMNVDQSRVQERLDQVSDTVVNNFESEARRLASDHVRQKLYNEVDVNHLVREIILTEINKKLATFAFPRSSIPGEAINSKTLVVSGNNIKGGIIESFSSTGIEDKSSNVQMTLLDQGVVIENKMITLGLEVKGQTVIEGDLHIKGNLPMDSEFFQKIISNTVDATRTSLDADLFEGFSNTIFERIRENGIDIDKLLVNGQNLVEGNKLSYTINDTNITRLGVVRDFQTIGDSFIGQTLYVTGKRIGINTQNPAHALTVWDEEIELGAGKRQRDLAWFGVPREQSLVISANQQDNLIINKDGSVSINKLVLNQVEICTSAGTPKTAAPRGSVMFNSDPVPGSPAGWVSMGGGAWSRFGTLG